MAAVLLMFAEGVAAASSAVVATNAQGIDQPHAASQANQGPDQNRAQHDAKNSRYCNPAATGTDPNQNEDLKPMAVQIRDTLRREYCGQ